MLSRDEILARRPTRMEKVEMPEWGGTFHVREMSAGERDSFEAIQLKQKIAGNELFDFRAKFVARTVCDENGARVFTDNDIAAVSELPIREVDRVFKVALKLNSLTEKDVEDILGNSSTAPNGK